MIERGNWIFWDYLEEYGIYDEDGSLTGFRDDAPEEVKKSWEEYQKLKEKWRAEGIQ